MLSNGTLVFILIVGFGVVAHAQTVPVQPITYPRIAGYFSIVHVLYVVDGNGITHNFSPAYTVGFPTGINILKSDRIGFSFEITPFIRAEDGNARVSNVLFHPGVMFRFPKRFTINQRLAFETSGRFGETTVFNKVVKVNKNSTYFIAIPVPVRLGNNAPVSIGIGLQFGIGF